jgi:predicted Ser/Thr protein kinase
MSSFERFSAVADAELVRLEAEFDRFESAWRSGSPPDIEQFYSDVSSKQEFPDALGRQRFLAELVAIDLERRWRATSAEASTTIGGALGASTFPLRPRLEDYLERFPALAGGGEFPIDLVAHEYRARALWGDAPDVSEYVSRFPEHADAVRKALAELDREMQADRSVQDRSTHVSQGEVARQVAETVDSDQREVARCEAPPLPAKIARFEVLDVLGSGGFGVVYRARDPQLNREVAIKMPRADCVRARGGAEAYLAEARTIARLDHPGIVPVYEAGLTDDGMVYVVTKLMSGGNLAQWIARGRTSVDRAASLVARVAEALHHAHERGLVHRDIKPANILLDADGKPYVVDFGLALHEDDFGSGPGFVGTLAYMSPEQASDSGHLVDARSDIFSLGLVLFELLSGKSPYRGKSKQQLVEEITVCDPRPIRQLDAVVPQELDRICQKARATRPAERYATAKDLASDLRAFLKARAKQSKPRWLLPAALAALAAAATAIAVGVYVNRDVAAPPALPAQMVKLDAPFLDLSHVVSTAAGQTLMEVMPSSMPLEKDDYLAVNVELAKGQEGYVYLFQFDEGHPPKLLSPDPSKKTRSVRFPGANKAFALDGTARRIMFVAAVSSTPLDEQARASIAALAFSFDDVTADKPMHRLYFPSAPKEGETRTTWKNPPVVSVVPVDDVRLSTNPGRELQKYFDAFSAIVFPYQTLEPK